ncbi:MAG: hypothetical protein KBH93_07985 [Anaerolineae bacterium]|nr:hypothetical protein [Anaerolineae bacterium]
MNSRMAITRDLELAWATAQELYRFAQRLVQTPSLSTHEGDAAALLVEHLCALGFADVRGQCYGQSRWARATAAHVYAALAARLLPTE